MQWIGVNKNDNSRNLIFVGALHPKLLKHKKLDNLNGYRIKDTYNVNVDLFAQNVVINI